MTREPEAIAGLRSGLPEAPPCPFCTGNETRLVSPFGSQLSVATYWCDRCRSPFELMKWRDGCEQNG